jgi:VWFA-related protein
MKLQVACLLVLATFTSGAVGQRQNRPRSQKTASEPRTQTIRICQGVPIPDGYVIVAYMTSTVCPHGAYILRKQDQSESSLAISRKASTSAIDDSRTKPNASGNRSPSSRNSSSAKSARDREPRPATGSNETAKAPSSGPQSANVTSAGTMASASRPRRATEENSQEQTGPPTLIGNETARSMAPPKLTNRGTSSEPPSMGPAPAADPTPEEVEENDIVRVDTMLVTVPVSVLDRQGRFIPGLKREDFTLLENGEQQPIAYFETAEKPFTVALLLDTSASTQFQLDEIKRAAIAFAKQLRPQDRVLVVTFNSEVLLLTEATNDVNLMEAAIEEYANTGTATRLYDAVDLTIQERLNRIKGRKAIVLFTDGVDTASQKATYKSTVDQVQELDALIYPIQYDTTDYMQAMQNSGSVTVTTTQQGPFGITTSKQTYNGPLNGGARLPGTTKADYDRAGQYLNALADRTGGRLYQATTQRNWLARFPVSQKSCGGNTHWAITQRAPISLMARSVRFACACANQISR